VVKQLVRDGSSGAAQWVERRNQKIVKPWYDSDAVARRCIHKKDA